MRIVNLALQGGGSHGAFTWGVLDALLADPRLGFEGLSGTSAGAVNAVALASGWAAAEHAGRDPREGARECLRRVWTQVGELGSLHALPRQLLAAWFGGLPPLREMLSPYQANPLDLNPLRDLLAREIDFDAMAGHPLLKVFVSATHVATGKAVVFGGRKLGVDAVLASACLPLLFRAVEIDGEAYWDGGYSVNPALSPLISHCGSVDLLLVQINPLQREGTPRTSREILDRASELAFNASLLTQMRAIEFINRLVAEGAVPESRGKRVLVHRIDGGAALREFPISSRTSADGALIDELFGLGQQAAREWVAQHYDALGRHGTVDIRRDYLDDTRLEVPTAVASRRLRPLFRPWLAGLLRRNRG